MSEESLQAPVETEPKLDAEPLEGKPAVEASDDLAPPVDPPAELPTESAGANETDEEPADEAAGEVVVPIGPRWFAVHTSSQPTPVNLLLRDAVSDHAANEAAVIARFKFGHGITHTPHELRVRDLGADYVPTGADVDHHEAIEAAIASAASAK